jgi:hypothetical protein
VSVRAFGSIAYPRAQSRRFSVARSTFDHTCRHQKGTGVDRRQGRRVQEFSRAREIAHTRSHTETRGPAVCPEQAGLENCRTNQQHWHPPRRVHKKVAAAGIADCSCQRPRWATLHELVKLQKSGVISRNSPQARVADVKRQRLLTEASAGRVPSQDHTLERRLTLTPPTSGSVASRFMTEKSAFAVFGDASGRRNGWNTGSDRTPGISCAATQCVGASRWRR